MLIATLFLWHGMEDLNHVALTRRFVRTEAVSMILKT